MGRTDKRVSSGALVGSTASGGGRWSDLDVTFGLKPGTEVDAVLSDWTQSLDREFGAVRLFDLPNRSSIYRVFLFPGNLQVDVSFTPQSGFGVHGPRFKLVFGGATEQAGSQPPSPQHLFGYAVHHSPGSPLYRERSSVAGGILGQCRPRLRSVPRMPGAGVEHRLRKRL